MTPKSISIRMRERVRSALFFLSFLFFRTTIYAQDGNTGLSQANTMIRSYYDNVVLIMYAVGAICGIVGAIKVYANWGHNDRDAKNSAMIWFGGCIFLVTVSTVIKSFFGI